MKKYILFGLLGGLVLFFWQFLSNAALDFHQDFHHYTEHQDDIVLYIDSLQLEEGSYMMPMYPTGLSQEEIEKYMESKRGKSWIILQYHKNWDMNMIIFARTYGYSAIFFFVSFVIIGVMIFLNLFLAILLDNFEEEELEEEAGELANLSLS